MELSSPILRDGETIPARYTCDADNVSPPLVWHDVPEETEALALIVDDPDAPAKVWVHWVLYDIPPDVTWLPEGVPQEQRLDNGAVHGTNDFETLGYGGPCPPGGTHRYRFTLYALDAKLNLPPGATKYEVLQAMESHVLDQQELVGRYRRER
jgi:Raf kinase inhibitor-like YbhB/YbcL family protein